MPLTDNDMQDLADMVRRVRAEIAINEQLNLIVPQVQALREQLRALKITDVERARYADLQRQITA